MTAIPEDAYQKTCGRLQCAINVMLGVGAPASEGKILATISAARCTRAALFASVSPSEHRDLECEEAADTLKRVLRTLELHWNACSTPEAKAIIHRFAQVIWDAFAEGLHKSQRQAAGESPSKPHKAPPPPPPSSTSSSSLSPTVSRPAPSPPKASAGPVKPMSSPAPQSAAGPGGHVVRPSPGASSARPAAPAAAAQKQQVPPPCLGKPRQSRQNPSQAQPSPQPQQQPQPVKPSTVKKAMPPQKQAQGQPGQLQQGALQQKLNQQLQRTIQQKQGPGKPPGPVQHAKPAGAAAAATSSAPAPQGQKPGMKPMTHAGQKSPIQRTQSGPLSPPQSPAQQQPVPLQSQQQPVQQVVQPTVKNPKFRSKLGEQRSHQRVGSGSLSPAAGEEPRKVPTFMSTKYHSGLSSPSTPASPEEPSSQLSQVQECVDGSANEDESGAVPPKQMYQQAVQRSSLPLQAGQGQAPQNDMERVAARHSLHQASSGSEPATPKSPQTDSSTPQFTDSPGSPQQQQATTVDAQPADESASVDSPSKQPHELLIEQQEDYETEDQTGEQVEGGDQQPAEEQPAEQDEGQQEQQEQQPAEEQPSEADMYYDDQEQVQQPVQGAPPAVSGQPQSVAAQVPLPQVGAMPSASVPLPSQLSISQAVPLPLNLGQATSYDYDDDELYGESTTHMMPSMLLPPPVSKDPNGSVSSGIPPNGLAAPNQQQQFFSNGMQNDPNAALYMQQCDYDYDDMYGA